MLFDSLYNEKSDFSPPREGRYFPGKIWLRSLTQIQQQEAWMWMSPGDELPGRKQGGNESVPTEE